MTTFSYSSGNPANLTGGHSASMSDISGPFSDLTTFLNGNITAVNVTDSGLDNDTLDATTVAAKVGLSQTGTVRRGKSIIATEESRTSTSYGTMTTPDRVQNVVLPTDGLLCVAYQAMIKNTTAQGGVDVAAVFVGSNQLKTAINATAAPTAQAAQGNGNVSTYQPISTAQAGLSANVSSTAYTGDVTTGQAVYRGNGDGGGFTTIFAAAGTYDISIQFKSSSGSVTVKNRNLWVWTLGF